MILFKSEDFINHKEKFKITEKHENTLDYFTKKYENAVRILNKTALDLRYQLNSKSYPYLFLLRHFSELKLKSILAQRGQLFDTIHSFNSLINLINDIPEGLKKAIKHIDLDEDGSCYRYMYNKQGELGPLFNQKRGFLAFYKEQENIPTGSEFNFSLGVVAPFHKRLDYEFTFHFNEITNIGQFRSTYDELTTFLLNGIINEDVDVNDVYLPLLFLIRHSVELALKEGLLGMIHILDEPTFRKVNRIIMNKHSISKLFNTYATLLPDDVSTLPQKLRLQYENYLAQTGKLKESIHLFDSNSRYFQYPFDPLKEHLNLSTDSLINIIFGFLEVDAFLTFNIDILKEYNILPYSDKEMELLMEISN